MLTFSAFNKLCLFTISRVSTTTGDIEITGEKVAGRTSHLGDSSPRLG